MKQKIFIAGSALISLAVNLFGGWDTAFETLILFMGIDWFTGGVLLPVVFKKSPKSKSGTLESRAGWKGIDLFYVEKLEWCASRLLSEGAAARR